MVQGTGRCEPHGQIMNKRRTKNEQKTNNERGAEGEKVDLRGSY